MARVEIASQAWGWLADISGNGQPGVSVQIKKTDGTDATHYSAITGGSSATSALTTNSDGTIPRFIDEGSYDLTAGGITRRVEAVAGATVVLAERRVATLTMNEDEPWYGDWPTIGNAPGSVG